jgi:hypothetical protein
MTRARAGLLVLACTMLLAGRAGTLERGSPRLVDLPRGAWAVVPLGGDARCADGSPYAAKVRRGDLDALIVAFQGGGATWGPIDAASLLPQPPVGGLYQPRVRPVAASGLSAPPLDDPLDEATQVLVSYCSGDVHWGDADGFDVAGDEITQRGAANVRAVLGWLDDQDLTPSELTIVGCSAGAYGALLWAPSLQARYPHASRSLLLDAGLGVVQAPFLTGEFGLASWRVAGAFAENGVAEILEAIDVDYFERLVAAVAAGFGGPIGIASTDRDPVQAAYWYLMGEERSGFRIDPDVAIWSEAAMERIAALATIEGVSTFVSDWGLSRAGAGTTGHCLTEHNDLWRDAGEPFRSWWSAMRAGIVPPSVDLR